MKKLKPTVDLLRYWINTKQVFCQRELPKYLQENDWAHLYQSKIITYEYKQNVDGSCIGKPHYYTNKEQIEIY